MLTRGEFEVKGWLTRGSVDSQLTVANVSNLVTQDYVMAFT
jgi:hypothetical protein